MSDDERSDSTLPARASKRADATSVKLSAGKDQELAALETLVARRARLKPMKLQSAGKPHMFRQNPDDELAWLRLLDTFAVGDSDAASLLLNSLIWATDASDESDSADKANGVLALMHELEPRDALETMLCSQMAATHLQAMECFRCSNLANQTFEGRELNMRHGERLSRIFAQQVDALNKHRGKGQQKVTVEHVTVNAGGQAVVGNVGAGRNV